MSYLGIDLGTSGLRALLVNEDGQPVGSAETEYSVSNPHPGWSEQDPSAWIDALTYAIGALQANHPEFKNLRAIGVAGHMHGATLLDKDGHVLRPCILWNDVRSEQEAAQLDASRKVRELSGNIVFPGFTAPKLEWVRKHEPQKYEKVAKVLLPAAYINYYLTGEYVADMSDSAGTSWLDVANRNWSDELLKTSHMHLDQMPNLCEGCDIAGTLKNDLKTQWGLDHEVVVAGGAGDNAAAACGIGALSDGDGFVSLGTSGVILIARNSYAPAPQTAVHTFCHAVPDRWYQMGVMLSAADSLSWLSRLVGTYPGELTNALGKKLVQPGPISFLPYLSGERTPHNDSQIRGALTGLSTSSSKQDMTRAILEGVAFGLRDSLEALKSTGANIESLVAIGGGSQSAYWLKLIATVFNIELQLPKGSEFGAALGAARLGMVAANSCAPSDIIRSPDISGSISPDLELRDSFDDAYGKFIDMYPAIKQVQ